MSGVDSDINQASSKSTQTFVTALVTNLAVGGAQFGVFLIISRWKQFRHIYEPRLHLPPESKRQKTPLPAPRWQGSAGERATSTIFGLLAIIPAVILARDEDIITQNGLDAYLFVRFLKLMMWIFAPIAVVTWLILLPVYGTSTGRSVGLQQFNFGNVGADQQSRLAAPLVIIWFSTFYIIYIIRREWGFYVEKRQDFLSSRAWSTKAQARTVMLTGIPDDYCDIDRLTSLTRHLPGGVRKVWLARDVKELADLYDRRQAATKKLESANISIIKLANKLVRKGKVPLEGNEPARNDKEKLTAQVAARYVPAGKRPTHRLGKIPLIGQKVDTITWAEEEIGTLNMQLEERRKNLSAYPPRSSAFILFNDQIAAHMFAQCLAHDLPLRMSGRFIDVSPNDIIWLNTNVNPYFARIRYVASVAATCAIIIFWSFPTAFVTSISNVSNLCETVSWLAWLCTAPPPVNGIIQGVLPPVALMLLFMLVPPVFRFLAVFAGHPMKTQVEHSLQRRYFAFLFIQGFIVATLSSGIMASIQQIIDSPGSTVNLLAENLPKSSIFFLTLVVTNGLSGAAGNALQIVKILLYYVKTVLLGGSPRSVYSVRFEMSNTSWGQTFPGQSLTAVIALAYSSISPLVCGFAVLTFALWWWCWKYLFLWVYDQPPDTETGGKFFKTAINQLFIGLYIEHLCLIGLFFLARDTQGNVSALPQAILTIILLVFTIFAHVTLDSGFSPLSTYLPLSMADELNANEARYAEEMAEERHQARYRDRIAEEHKRRSEMNNEDDEPSFSDTKGGRGEKTSPRQDGVTDAEDVEAGLGSYPPQRQQTQQTTSSETAEGTGFVSARDHEEEEDLDELEGGLDDHAFHHPALYKHQPIIWLPRDDLGLSDEAVKSARAHNINITNRDATIDAKGRIRISRDSIPGTEFDD